MNKKTIIGVVLVLVIGFGGWKIWSNFSKGDTNGVQSSMNTKTTNKESSSNKESTNSSKEANQDKDNKDKTKKEDTSKDKTNKEDNKRDNNSSQEEKSDSNSSSSTASNSESSSNSTKSKTKVVTTKVSGEISSNSKKTSKKISQTGVKVNEIGGFTGTFVEDGSNRKVNNVLSLKVKNTSKKDIQYCSIEMKINDNQKATFNVTNLPSGKTATVLESTGKVQYKSSSKYNVTNCTYAGLDKLPMNTNKVKVSTSGSDITIKNISNKDLGTVYVYYKNIKNGSYLGGITYRAKFENVGKGESVKTSTSHFTKSSQIVMVDTEK